FYGLLTTSAKLYADLSQVSQGNAKILLLADFPDQVTLYTIKGKIETKYLKADGTVQENDTGLPVAESSKPVSASIFPAAGSQIGVAEWKNSPWIDVAFAAGAEKTLNTATILDVAAELELLGPDGSKV
ncbi:MAG: hypothetical protein ACKPHU_12670, partial [Planctomycetaceae bacterium]